MELSCVFSGRPTSLRQGSAVRRNFSEGGRPALQPHPTYSTYPTRPAFARACCPTRATAGKPDLLDLPDPPRLRSHVLSDASYGGQARPTRPTRPAPPSLARVVRRELRRASPTYSAY